MHYIRRTTKEFVQLRFLKETTEPENSDPPMTTTTEAEQHWYGWINFASLIVSSVLFTVYYAWSVSPERLERRRLRSERRECIAGSDAKKTSKDAASPSSPSRKQQQQQQQPPTTATAYEKCASYRIIACVFMTIAGANYVLYYRYPLPPMESLLPSSFPWPHSVSAALAASIAAPSTWLMVRGMADAGEGTMRPRKEHELYGGIYERVRHPQAIGEFPLWFVLALLAHSPFLMLFSLLYVPVWYYFAVVEEQDLALRYGKRYEDYRRRVDFFKFRRRPARELS